MKRIKRFLTLLLILSILCGSVFACRKRDNPETTSEGFEEEEDDDDDYSRANIVPPQYLAPGEQSWFEQHNLEYTPEGNFSLHATANIDTGDITLIPADARIYEDRVNCEPGYRNVVIIFTIDTRGASYQSYWTSSFDKYTGTSFEFMNGSNSIYNGCHIINTGSTTLYIADYVYTITITEDIVQTDDITIMTWTVNCPAEYDGIVFQIGYSDGHDTYFDFNGTNTFYADDFTDVENENFNYFTVEAVPVDKQ